jgi:hypothetical protein
LHLLLVIWPPFQTGARIILPHRADSNIITFFKEKSRKNFAFLDLTETFFAIDDVFMAAG